MTTTFATDNKNNDLFLGNDGNLVVLHGLPAVEAACATATKLQLGEAVLATGLGIPNFQTVWVGTPNLPLFTSRLRAAINGVIGVTGIASLELSTPNNTLSYVATITSEFGGTTING